MKYLELFGSRGIRTQSVYHHRKKSIKQTINHVKIIAMKQNEAHDKKCIHFVWQPEQKKNISWSSEGQDKDTVSGIYRLG